MWPDAVRQLRLPLTLGNTEAAKISHRHNKVTHWCSVREAGVSHVLKDLENGQRGKADTLSTNHRHKVQRANNVSHGQERLGSP